jgi:uncharacterized protein (TIGR00159 family)
LDWLEKSINWAEISFWVMRGIDLSLVIGLVFIIFLAIGDRRRTIWIARGLLTLVIAAFLSRYFKLSFLSFALEKLVIGAGVAMAIAFQTEFRHFLEQLGRGDLSYLFRGRRSNQRVDSPIDSIVEAVKEMSQRRIGGLLIVETSSPLDDRDFSAPGIKLDAELSKELLQTIFQPTTLLHDGAVLIRGDRVIAAGVILPLSGQNVSAQLGTRHRAALGITEKVSNCLCVVVSEETGSISLAEKGSLNRPLTSSKLKEILESHLIPETEQKTKATGWKRFMRTSWRRRFFAIVFKSKK